MFLRKEIKKVKTGNELVPFCIDCNSQEILTTRTCRKCGSHNVKTDWMDDRSSKAIYTEEEVNVFKCDHCGKEFDGFKVDNIITFSDYGEFLPYKYTDDYGDCGKYYSLDEDLCVECKDLIVKKLNNEIDNIAKQEHVLEVLKEVMNSEK